MSKIWWTLGVRSALAFALAGACDAHAEPPERFESGRLPVGAVVAARGEAVIEHAGARQAAVAGVSVRLNDRATTGAESRLDLKLGEATRLRLGANAALTIDQFVAKASAQVSLEDGAVLVDRAKDAEKTFELKTPYGLLAARGTVFFVGPSQGVFGVFVQKGALDIVTQSGSVRLNAGDGVDFAVNAEAPGAAIGFANPKAPKSVKKWRADRVKEALESVR